MLPLAVLVFSLTMAAAMLLFLSTMQTPAQTSLASQGGHMNRRMFPGYHSIESTQQLANKLADPSSSDKAVDVASTVAKSAAQKAVDAVTTVAAAVAQTPVLVQKAARIVANVKELQHPFESLQHYYTLQPVDSSPRCQQSGICDGDHSCGPDALGCVTAARDRQVHIRRAIAWSWESYRYVFLQIPMPYADAAVCYYLAQSTSWHHSGTDETLQLLIARKILQSAGRFTCECLLADTN